VENGCQVDLLFEDAAGSEKLGDQGQKRRERRGGREVRFE
tara:strand:- start:266 stop:385 length:120 start_codon:yes stop_codon:yes gene_type:complete